MPFNADNNNQNNQDDQNINKDKNQENSAIGLAGSGGAGSTPNGAGRIANYSSGQQQAQQGSGRFTNLQKYIGANQGAGERMGNQIGKKYDNTLNKQKGDVDSQNSQIAQNIQTGKDSLNEGTGYTNQLKNIGEGFNTFKSFEDRQGFDDAATQAQQFTSSPNFNRFQTIQSGNAIDNEAALAAQNNAVLAGTNLNTFTQDQLGKVGNDQGRYDLLKDTFGNKKNYSSGNARFDQLFLQNDPSNPLNNLSNKFNQGNLAAGQVMNTINNQGKDVNQLLTDETGVVTGINDQAKATQDAFNTNLYGGDNFTNNLNYVNAARDANFNDIRTGLQNGSLSQEQVDQLGIGNINRYDPRFGGQVQDVNALGADGKMTLPGQAGVPEFVNQAPTLGTYNLLKDPYAVDQYIKKGKNAVSAQDITTNDDYNAYKALQNISGIDSGKVQGASQLGSSVLDGDKNLANEMTKANDAFSTLDENGGLKRSANAGNWGYTAESGNFTDLLNLREQLEARGLNGKDILANFGGNGVMQSDQLRNVVNQNKDLFDKYMPQSTFGPPTTGRGFSATYSNDIGTDSGSVNWGTRMRAYNNAMNNIEDQGYYNTIKVDPTKAAPKRYKGLL